MGEQLKEASEARVFQFTSGGDLIRDIFRFKRVSALKSELNARIRRNYGRD